MSTTTCPTPSHLAPVVLASDRCGRFDAVLCDGCGAVVPVDASGAATYVPAHESRLAAPAPLPPLGLDGEELDIEALFA